MAAGSVVKAAPARKTAWRFLEMLHDAFTISVSVADIATDIIVCVQFAETKQWTCFGVSAGIFLIAQVSYAFLFAASYAGHRSPCARAAVFLAVLPLAQLVPVFSWLEALHLPKVDAALRRLGLEPTAASSDGSSGDSLWGFLQSKYRSHAGFLVEAFVEAVPQAVLQTVFMVATGQGTPLNAFSVALSVFTIASKGYLVSYALDSATFAFNFLCFVADCFGLFASTTVLALGSEGADTSDPLSRLVLRLLLAGLCLSVLAGFGLLWFVLFDDHLKIRHPVRWPHGVSGIGSIVFDLYIVRVAAWFLAIIPCVVLFAGARLALLPVAVLRSIDPDLVRHASFYTALHRFLHAQGGGAPGVEARLLTANGFLAKARRCADGLDAAVLCASPGERPAAIRRWATQVGVTSPLLGYWRPAPAAAAVEEEDEALQMALLQSMSVEHSQARQGALCRCIRRSWLAVWLNRQRRNLWQGLRRRSEVFGGTSSAQLRRELVEQPVCAALRVSAILALGFAAVAAVPLFAAEALLVALGVAFPLVRAVPQCFSNDSWSTAALPCSLGATYAAVSLAILCLAPLVARRQGAWLGLADLHGFPERFYGNEVICEIRRRHLRDSFLRQNVGFNLTRQILGFIGES